MNIVCVDEAVDAAGDSDFALLLEAVLALRLLVSSSRTPKSGRRRMQRRGRLPHQDVGPAFHATWQITAVKTMLLVAAPTATTRRKPPPGAKIGPPGGSGGE